MAKIEVIQIEFWDGTKYIARTDKADCHEQLRKITLEKRAQFEALSLEVQKDITKTSLKAIGGLSRRTPKTIDEDLYNSIKTKGKGYG